MMIYEALADGRLGVFGLLVCWVAIGIPCVTMGAAWLRWTFLHFHEEGGSLWRYFAKVVAMIAVAAIPGLFLNLLVRGTLGYFRKKTKLSS
ncbi:hypothetical protein DVJ77_20480 [Dyella tabacisoli]|uniref:Uncharacterized protein n=2 Tax=Dyella tabacisoli TaxID=2282381 RepID=A0A369UGZ7_9GAMM|nr:hypothetical protein DVJ77_20480 [Dyella tabacisoli]